MDNQSQLGSECPRCHQIVSDGHYTDENDYCYIRLVGEAFQPGSAREDLAEKLKALHSDREAWRVEKEPHNYADGTKHFNHVRYISDDGVVEVASYVTPELGELLCLLHNNLGTIIAALSGCEAVAPLEPEVEIQIERLKNNHKDLVETKRRTGARLKIALAALQKIYDESADDGISEIAGLAFHQATDETSRGAIYPPADGKCTFPDCPCIEGPPCPYYAHSPAALPSEAIGREWQDISTAPKDRFIFVYCPEDQSRWLAKWQDGEWYGSDCEHGLLRTGYSAGNPDVVTGWAVSHWREVASTLSRPNGNTP